MKNRELFKQAEYLARFEWGYEGVEYVGIGASLVVIIDVLSFTTCVDVVVGRGGTVFPYRVKDESAAAFAREHNAVLAGKRGEPISLSPASLASIPWGRRIVLPSPNGSTCSFLAKDGDAVVVAACLRNASAVGRYIRQHGGSVALIACGERWPNGTLRPSYEDMVAAGAILQELPEDHLSPEAKAAVAVYQSTKDHLGELLKKCGSGQELISLGYPEDVAIASQLNVSEVVPILNKDYAFA